MLRRSRRQRSRRKWLRVRKFSNKFWVRTLPEPSLRTGQKQTRCGPKTFAAGRGQWCRKNSGRWQASEFSFALLAAVSGQFANGSYRLARTFRTARFEPVSRLRFFCHTIV
jgi:hypothetical protein